MIGMGRIRRRAMAPNVRTALWRQGVPQHWGWMTGGVHGDPQATAPQRAGRESRFSDAPRSASNYQRHCEWGIENRLHHVRDVSFREDDSRIRRNPGIFARLRSFAANILRFNNVHNMSNGRYRIAVGGVDAMLSLRVM